MVLSTRKRKKGGMSKGTERKLKSRANWTACFLRASLTAQCGWLCLSLSLSYSLYLSLPLSLSLITLFQAEEKEDGRGGKRERKRLVSTVMTDERERDRFCLVAHLFSFSLFFLSSLSLFFLKSTYVPLSRSLPPERLSVPVSNLLITPPLLSLVFSTLIPKTSIHPFPISSSFPLISSHFMQACFQHHMDRSMWTLHPYTQAECLILTPWRHQCAAVPYLQRLSTRSDKFFCTKLWKWLLDILCSVSY